MLVLFTTHYLTNCVGAVYYRCKARNFCGSFAWPASSACSNSPNTATACGFSLVSYVLYPEWCTILWYIHNIVYIYTHYKIRLAPGQALQIQHYLCYILNTGLLLLMLCTIHWTATTYAIYYTLDWTANTYAIYYTLSYLYYFILGVLSFFMLISVFFLFFSFFSPATLIRSWRALGMLSFFMLISVILFSSVMYFVEKGRFFYCTQSAANASLCLQAHVWLVVNV